MAEKRKIVEDHSYLQIEDVRVREVLRVLMDNIQILQKQVDDLQEQINDLG